MGVTRRRRYPFTLKPLPAGGLIASAGDDQSIEDGSTTATLVGSATGGIGPYAYAWSRVSGGSATFDDAESASTGVTLGDTAVLRLTVQDATNTVATDDVEIAVEPVPATAFGASLIDYWMSDRGVSFVAGAVDQWGGQVAGIVLGNAGGRPAYTTSDANGNGQPSINCAKTGSKAMWIGALTPITAVGDHLGVFCVARYRGFSAITFSVLFGLGIDTPLYSEQMYVDTDGIMKARSTNVSPLEATGTYATTTRLYYMVSQTNNFAWATGSDTSTRATGYNGVSFAATTIGLGCGNISTDWADVDIFEAVIVAAPTAPQIADYAAAVAARYGAETP